MAERYQEKYDAFIHELYETYSRLIYKEAWKYFDSLYDVEDLVQEVWIKLCQKADQLYKAIPHRKKCQIPPSVI